MSRFPLIGSKTTNETTGGFSDAVSKNSGRKKAPELRAALASGRLLRFPGAFSPLVSMLIEQIGFDGVYISGAVISNDLGFPDIGLTTLTEVRFAAGPLPGLPPSRHHRHGHRFRGNHQRCPRHPRT